MAEAQIRGEPAGAILFRAVALRRVVAKSLLHEGMKCLHRLFASAAPMAGSLHGPVQSPSAREVLFPGQRAEARWRSPGHARFRIAWLDQKLREKLMKPGPYGTSGIVLASQEPGRHDHVSVHRPERYANLPRYARPPVLRIAQRILIANNHGSLHFLAELQQAVQRIRAQHKADAAPRQGLRDIGYAVSKKAEMAQVGLGAEWRRREEDNHRLT